MFSVDFTLQNFEYFLLILTRISMFIVAAPFFNTRNVPRMTKIGFAALVSFMLYFVVPRESLSYSTVIGYAFLVFKEALTGLMIGFAAYVCDLIILFAGTVIDMDIGLSMVTEFDPTTRMETSISGNLYHYFILLLLIVTNMYQYLLRAICDSYQLIPIGGTVFRTDALLLAMIDYMTSLYIIAFRIMLPVFACIMILNCILGIMVKVSPQMNMFAVGMQLKILVGFGVLFLTAFLLPEIADFIFKEMKTLMVSIIKGLY